MVTGGKKERRGKTKAGSITGTKNPGPQESVQRVTTAQRNLLCVLLEQKSRSQTLLPHRNGNCQRRWTLSSPDFDHCQF